MLRGIWLECGAVQVTRSVCLQMQLWFIPLSPATKQIFTRTGSNLPTRQHDRSDRYDSSGTRNVKFQMQGENIEHTTGRTRAETESVLASAKRSSP